MKSPGSSNSSRSAKLWGNQEVQDRAGGEQHKSETQRKSRLSRIRLLGARLVALLPDDGDCCRVVSIAAAVAAIQCKPKVVTTRTDSRQTATGALATYCSHAAERILAACSMLP